jgi:hypothetical protein
MDGITYGFNRAARAGIDRRLTGHREQVPASPFGGLTHQSQHT